MFAGFGRSSYLQISLYSKKMVLCNYTIVKVTFVVNGRDIWQVCFCNESAMFLGVEIRIMGVKEIIMDRTPEEIRNAIFKKLDVIHSQYEFWVDYAEKLEKENKELHRLLDLRDDDYFRFCETGRMPDEEDTADAE